MADISKIKIPNGTTYDVNISSTLKLRYPKGNANATDIVMQSLIDVQRANRWAFLPPEQIIIEKTIDGGNTWTDAGVSDTAKAMIFSPQQGSIPFPQIDGKKNVLCGIRITVTGMKYNVPAGTTETQKYAYWNDNYVDKTERYHNINGIYFWVSTSNDTMNVLVQKATGANPNAWSDCFRNDSFYMTGWSGYDFIPTPTYVFGGEKNKPGNYWNWRITLMTRGKNGSTTEMNTGYETQQQTVGGIRAYGPSVWSSSNSLMRYDRLATVAWNKNVTYPAQITSTQFNGPLNGNAMTATTATNVTGSAGTANVYRHVWFSDSASETKRTYDDDFRYNPSTNALTTGGSINGYTLNAASEKDVDSIVAVSSNNLPTSAAVANYVISKGYTTNRGTVTSVITGIGLTGGPITEGGTIKANLRSESSLTVDSEAQPLAQDRVYPVVTDLSGYLAVNVPWVNTRYNNATSSTAGLMSAEDKAKLDALQPLVVTETQNSGGGTTITISGGVV